MLCKDFETREIAPVASTLRIRPGVLRARGMRLKPPPFRSRQPFVRAQPACSALSDSRSRGVCCVVTGSAIAPVGHGRDPLRVRLTRAARSTTRLPLLTQSLAILTTDTWDHNLINRATPMIAPWLVFVLRLPCISSVSPMYRRLLSRLQRHRFHQECCGE